MTLASLSEVKVLADACATAIADADWSTAKSKALQAQAKLFSIPDGKHGAAEMSLARETVKDLLAEIRREETAAGAASSSGALQSTRFSWGGVGTDC